MARFAMLALSFLFVATSAAEEPLVWPRFRGPDGSGVADTQKPPVEFGPEKNLRWKIAVPDGLSSPIIAGDKLVLTAFEGGKLWTVAYDRATGKEAWRCEAPAKKIEPFLKDEGSPAASTPVTDGQRIISYFGSCGFFCYDLAGKELWRHELPMTAAPGDFGTGTSPILADGIVIIVRDEIKNARILAIDAATGKLKWEKARTSPASYSTPVVWETPRGKQVAVAGHARMVGYDLQTGEEKWNYFGIPSGCCTSPVVAEGLLLFAGWSPGGADDKENQMPSFDAMLKQQDKDKDGALSKEEFGKQMENFFDSQDANKDGKVTRDEWDAVIAFMKEGKNAAFALKPGGQGDISTQALWKQTKGLPYIASALAYRGQYLMVRDGGIINALDIKTGKEIYQERVAAPGQYYASPVAANGNVYVTARNDGSVTVLKAGGTKAEVVAKNPKLGEKVAATPAIADDTIFIRGEKHLWAFGTRPAR